MSLENALETLAKAINNHADAIRGAGSVPAVGEDLTREEINQAEDHNEKAAAEKAKADKAAADKKAKAAADKAAADKKAKADKAAADKAAAEKAAAEEQDKEEASAGDDEANELTEADLIAAFSKYLPKDLSKEERAKRAPAIKKFLTGKGAAKATELNPSDYAEAIDFVNGLIAELDADGGDEDDLL